jgi:hypothetical protein
MFFTATHEYTIEPIMFKTRKHLVRKVQGDYRYTIIDYRLSFIVTRALLKTVPPITKTWNNSPGATSGLLDKE